jgi:hypothetical protein
MKYAAFAEEEGFEPSVDLANYDGLANRWFQPLTHPSLTNIVSVKFS